MTRSKRVQVSNSRIDPDWKRSQADNGKIKTVVSYENNEFGERLATERRQFMTARFEARHGALMGPFLLAVCLMLFGGASWAANATPKETSELSQGELLINKRQWTEAEKWFYNFVKQNPQHAEGLRKAGLVELRRPGGDKVRARQYLERAMKIEPEDPIGLFLLGKAYEVNGLRQQAMDAYQKLVDEGPGRDNPPRAAAVHVARFNRALLAEEDGDLDTAIPLFNQVLGREPQNAYATYELGLIAREQGKIDEAIEWLRKATNNVNLWAPTEAWVYPQGRYGYIRENSAYELAKTLQAEGKIAEAEKVLEPVVDMVMIRAKAKKGHRNPSPKAPLETTPDLRFENAPFYYAELLAAQGKKKEAAKLLKQFSRMKIGDKKLRAEARTKAKQLR